MRDQFVAAPQTQQCSGARELALRKKTNDLAVRDFFGGSPNRGARTTGINWNTTDDAQEGSQDRFVIEFLVDDVTNGTRTGQLQHNRVDPADVIRQKEKSAGR